MLEVLIGVGVGAVVAFFCMQFYRQGVRDGRAIDNKGRIEPIVKLPEKKRPETEGRIADYLFSEGDKK